MRRKKGSLLALGLAAAVAFTSGITVFADDVLNPETESAEATSTETAAIVGGTSDYTFEKLSHASKELGTTDGIVDYLGNGVDGVVTDSSDENYNAGDRGQSYSWAALSYESDKDEDNDGENDQYVYVGTCYNSMGSTLTLMKSALGDNYDEAEMKAELNALYNGDFFTGQEDGGNSNGILVKVNVKTGAVKIIMSQATNGISPMFRNGVEYNGKLYFCGTVKAPSLANGMVGLPSIWEIDPTDDSFQCVHCGLNMQQYVQMYRQKVCTGIRGMTEYDYTSDNTDQSALIVSSVGANGPYISISSDPSSGEFTEIANFEDLYEYPAYHYSDSIYGGSIWEMQMYNGSLYVAICTGVQGEDGNMPDENTMQSFAIVRGDCDGDPLVKENWTWTSVVGDQETDGAAYTFGIDPERTRAGACNMIVYDGYLYIGEYNDTEIALERILFDKDFNFMAANLEQSVSLYRMDENEKIELVMGDSTTMFPDSLSGLDSGFGGRRENQYIWQMTEFDGKLFIGTFDETSLLEPIAQFSNGEILNMSEEDMNQQMAYLEELISIMKKNGELEVPTEESVKAYLIELNAEMEELKSNLEEEPSADYVENYEDLYNLFQKIKTKAQELNLTEVNKIINKLDQVFTNENLQNMKSLGKILEVMSTADKGFDCYVSEDGVNFKTITTDGMGDGFNHGLRVFATTSDYMVIGTANPFYGTQLWKMESENYVEPTPKEEPSTEPSTEEVTEEPSTEEVTEEPSTEEVTEEPSTEEVTEEPSTEEVTEEPSTEEKSTEENVESDDQKKSSTDSDPAVEKEDDVDGINTDNKDTNDTKSNNGTSNNDTSNGGTSNGGNTSNLAPAAPVVNMVQATKANTPIVTAKASEDTANKTEEKADTEEKVEDTEETSEEVTEETIIEDEETPTAASTTQTKHLPILGIVAGVILVLAAGGCGVYVARKKRK